MKQLENKNPNKTFAFTIVLVLLAIAIIAILVMVYFKLNNLPDLDSSTQIKKDFYAANDSTVPEIKEGNPINLIVQSTVETGKEEIKKKSFFYIDKSYAGVEPTISLEDRLIYTDYPNAIVKKVWVARYKIDTMSNSLIFDTKTGEFLFSEGF